MATDVDGAAVPEPDVDASIAAMFDPSAKKKKKKTKAKADADEATAGAAPSDSVDAGLAAPAVAAAAAPASASETAPNSHSLGSTVDGDDEISYEDMLSRVYKLLYANNPELTDRCAEWYACSLEVPARWSDAPACSSTCNVPAWW